MTSTDLAREVIRRLVQAGVTDLVLAPGSRNAPLSFALLDAERAGALRLHTRIDERSAGFLALGLARTSGRPVAVSCTSGTAVANLAPAALEAHHEHLPWVAVTADRPLRLRGTSANQTTDQVGLLARAEVLDLAAGAAAVTAAGLRTNVRVGIRYLAAWLGGNGAVAIDNLMEDAATAEISRSQIWQWVHNKVTLADTGEQVTEELVRALVDALEVPGEHAAAAKRLFLQVALAEEFEPFLTLPAYALVD